VPRVKRGPIGPTWICRTGDLGGAGPSSTTACPPVDSSCPLHAPRCLFVSAACPPSSLRFRCVPPVVSSFPLHAPRRRACHFALVSECSVGPEGDMVEMRVGLQVVRALARVVLSPVASGEHVCMWRLLLLCLHCWPTSIAVGVAVVLGRRDSDSAPWHARYRRFEELPDVGCRVAGDFEILSIPTLSARLIFLIREAAKPVQGLTSGAKVVEVAPPLFRANTSPQSTIQSRVRVPSAPL
jgi:hypothetical protein